jgi:hypothetical protein
VNETGREKLLRLFGFFLALSHLLTFFYWGRSIEGFLGVMTDPYPVCWPFFPGCESWQPRFPIEMMSLVLGIYGSTACAAAASFLFPKLKNFAVPLLAIASLVKLFLYLQDYRMMGAYHYMHWWVLGAYFFIAQSDVLIRFLLPAFYFSAGLLKLNREWLSGSAGPWPQSACIYVVVLELVLVWGLLSRNRWIFWATIAQLFVFHVFSYFVVGFYYPALMFCFLSLVVAGWFWAPVGWRSWRELGRPARRYLFLFFILQAVPWFLMGDPALDGKGRLFALNTADVDSQCKMKYDVHTKDGKAITPQPLYPRLGVRLHCDPVIKLAEARHYCRMFAQDENITGLDIALESKRKTDKNMREIFNFKDFCAHPQRPDIFGIVYFK